MSEIKALFVIIFLLFLISPFHISKVASKHSGFSLKLIHPYSSMSSPSNINDTSLERYKSYVHASKARASYWTSFANKTIHPDVIQPSLRKEREIIVVEILIGTPAQQVFLEFDTGSVHSWTQCASCTTCFPQSTTKFDPKLSKTYREMLSDDTNCRPPIFYIKNKKKCEYKSKYIDGQYTNGIASYETFRENNPFQSSVDNILFGCSLDTSGFGFPPDTIISGILGMSRAEESLPRQLSKYGGNNRFSYCLVDINTSPRVVNRVTFGDDIPYIHREYLSAVPFIKHRYPHAWAIKLLDISIGKERLNLPLGTFDPNPNGGNGGLILDTGSKFTWIARIAYLGIKSKIHSHLSKSKNFTDISGQSDLCYRYNGPHGQLPKEYLQTITFHLDYKVNLYMPVTNVYFFNWEDNSFCLGMLEAQSHWPNILGSLQQHDTRFIYDFNKNGLYFNREICAN